MSVRSIAASLLSSEALVAGMPVGMGVVFPGLLLPTIFVALAFAGCMYGVARAAGWRPRFRTVAWCTVAVMFGIAAYGELSIVKSGEATPNVGHVLPLVILGLALYLAGRGMEWFAERYEWNLSADDGADSEAQAELDHEREAEPLFGLPSRS